MEDLDAAPIYVAVCGSAERDESSFGQAEEVGRLIAREGAVLLSGGLTGVMEAACLGARSEGGLTVGLLPGDDRSAANGFVDVALPLGLGEVRNALLIRSCDVVIAVAGEFGTLSEIGFALKTGKPVVGLGTWELAKDGEPVDAIIRASSPEDAVAKAMEAARR